MRSEVGFEFLIDLPGRTRRTMYGHPGLQSHYSRLEPRTGDDEGRFSRRPVITRNRDDGRFDSLFVITNRARFGRDGTFFPAGGHDRGKLPHATEASLEPGRLVPR